MAKFAFFGSYSPEAWARMIENPKDRRDAVGKLIKSAGGTMESFYLMLGADDFIIIADFPDAVSAAAASVATASSGAVRNSRTIELIEWGAAPTLLAKAKTYRGEYRPPGS